MKVSTTLSYRVTWQSKARVSQDPCQRESRRGIYAREEKAQGRQGRSRPLLGGLRGRTSRAGGDMRTPRYDACGSVRSQSLGKESQEIRLTKDKSGSLAVTGSKKRVFNRELM